MSKSLEDILASIRNGKNITEHSTEKKFDEDFYLEESKALRSGSVIQEDDSIKHIKHALGELKEIDEKYVSIQKTEKLKIKESELNDLIGPMFNSWFKNNKQEIMNTLSSKIDIKDISQDLMKSIISSAIEERISEEYINNILIKHVKGYHSYIKQTIDHLIGNVIQDRLHETIEDVIRKIMRNK
ncbi:hypothetical protein FZC35_00015 [Candidatus Cytomitobacter indipagum]|uniref:Uncharacterized protein n=1 Tax=Candidatus Cytomitobacter indipagum TaxID=2601575 RepID=A0A5C0UFF6_9PROT|nr:hypothetical protein [Candidatus Cytomitobacter indipagum]QEK37784.1 hypothetical protein FZC35_00015 [Candidatus Cytomitobacter indipagum]